MMRSDISHTETPIAPPSIKDRVVIHQSILRLTAIYKTIAIAVVVISALIWLGVMRKIVQFGNALDYTGLEALGIDNALIKQYTPFFWWTVSLICTLLVIYLLFNFVQYTRRKASQKIVSQIDLNNLLRQISPSATQVLAWAWNDRRHPITVGVLQQTTNQLANNRYALICLAKTQEKSLQKHSQPAPQKTEPLHHL